MISLCKIGCLKKIIHLVFCEGVIDITTLICPPEATLELIARKYNEIKTLRHRLLISLVVALKISSHSIIRFNCDFFL